MAGIYKVQYATGVSGSPVWNDLLGGESNEMRFRTDTAITLDLTNPVPIPKAGFNYAFWVSLSLNFAGTFTQVDNIRHYSDGAIGWNFGTGGGLFVNSTPTGLTDAQYVQATGVVGTSGDEIVANHANVSAVADVEVYTSGSPLVVDTTIYTGVGNSKHIALQPKVATDATQGVQTAETLTWLVDEI